MEELPYLSFPATAHCHQPALPKRQDPDGHGNQRGLGNRPQNGAAVPALDGVDPDEWEGEDMEEEDDEMFEDDDVIVEEMPASPPPLGDQMCANDLGASQSLTLDMEVADGEGDTQLHVEDKSEDLSPAHVEPSSSPSGSRCDKNLQNLAQLEANLAQLKRIQALQSLFSSIVYIFL